jgi:hypothetical protein
LTTDDPIKMVFENKFDVEDTKDSINKEDIEVLI